MRCLWIYPTKLNVIQKVEPRGFEPRIPDGGECADGLALVSPENIGPAGFEPATS